MAPDWIRPEWPAPGRVRALSTTRLGGVSAGPYASLNLGEHVGDDPKSVAVNRERLQERLGLAKLRWLKQVHGIRVIADGGSMEEAADASVTRQAGTACVIMTADCLPVIFCDKYGTKVAAAHAGWRGLSAGVLEAALKSMDVAPKDVLAWMGPAIGPQAYEVGDEVRDAFVRHSAQAAQAFMAGKVPGKWWCDLYGLARQRLEAAGVASIHGGGLCTFSDEQRFFSFRRDGQCGRMATLVWLE